MTAHNGREDVPNQDRKTTMTRAEFFASELPPISDIVTFCNSLPMSLYADTTVVKSPEVVFRGTLLSQTGFVAQEYLLNSRRSEADLGVVIGINDYSLPMVVGALAHRDLEENKDELVALPPYRNVRPSLGSAIRSRRTIRHYAGKSISLDNLSTLLFHSAGISGKLEVGNIPETVSLGKTDKLDLRMTVSGGALYPVDLFIFAMNVEQLPVGAYCYLPKEHALKPMRSGDAPPAARNLAQFGEIEVDKAGFLIGYVYNVFENARKYGETGLGFAFLEAGAVAAHIHLLCTALGLGSCDVGSFSKNRCDRLFGADGISRHTIHLTVVGK
jgi:SagB-type dehydrogenase family enzyme